MEQETQRIKIKIDGHEFEAEGPINVVQDQFNAFKEMVASSKAHPQVSPPAQPSPVIVSTVKGDLELGGQELSKIMKEDGPTISLTVRANSVEDALLLIIYGQKVLRGKDLTTGGEIMAGLAATGLPVTRVDRLLEKISRDGDVIVSGARRSKRYRLTNSGASKVRQIAADLLATVA